MQVAGKSAWRHHPERDGRAPAERGLVVSALFFFPRGGSAQVARALARALPAAGWQLRLAAGSLGQPGEPTQAASFFAGIDLQALDYSPALGLAEPVGCVNSVTVDLQRDSAFRGRRAWAVGPALETTSGSQKRRLLNSVDA